MGSHDFIITCPAGLYPVVLCYVNIAMTRKEEDRLPIIDQREHKNIGSATLAMGCFWGPEAYFGAMEGIIRTRVGYAGGSTANPTYRDLADHIETVQVDYNPEKTSYEQILEHYFSRHSPTKEPYKRQYTSAIFYHSADQQKAAISAIGQTGNKTSSAIRVEVLPYQTFFMAEERHQKWKLRRRPELMMELVKIYPDFQEFNRSTAVARINGFLSGHGRIEQLLEEIASLGLSYPAQQILLNLHQTQAQLVCFS